MWNSGSCISIGPLPYEAFSIRDRLPVAVLVIYLVHSVSIPELERVLATDNALVYGEDSSFARVNHELYIGVFQFACLRELLYHLQSAWSSHFSS